MTPDVFPFPSVQEPQDLFTGPAIDAVGLCKRFGRREVVRDVSLRVESGTIFGMLGPNGAGKSTTIRMLLGLTDPDSGHRRILGSEDPLQVATSLGYLPEERGLYPGMKAIEAVAFMGALRGLSLDLGRERGRRLLEAYDIPPQRRVRDLSKGMAQLVQITGTIVHGPRLLVLDEPFSGLDPLNQERVEALIRDYVARGATVLLSTHVIPHVERLCDRIAIIDCGTVRFDGALETARTRLPAQVRVGFEGHDHEGIRSMMPENASLSEGIWTFRASVTQVAPILSRIAMTKAAMTSLTVERPSLQDVFRSVLHGKEVETVSDA